MLISAWMSLAMLFSPISAAGKQPPPAFQFIARKTCKQVDSCEEAVAIWCGGYRRADADSDGIPCENICHTLDQVNALRKKAGC